MLSENNPWGVNTANNLSRLAAACGLPTTAVEWRDADNAFYVNGERMGQSAQGVMEWIHKHPACRKHEPTN